MTLDTKKTLSGTAWSFAERYSVQCLQFLVMIVMARLLTPADYGLVGMVAIFTAVAQSLVDSGLSQALIRKQDRDDRDTSTAFYFNVAISVILYGLIWLAAPAIADFYGEPRLTEIARVLCLTIVINSAGVVQRAMIAVDLDFRIQAKASVTAAIAGGAVGITMALNGMGVWSLAGYQLTIATVASVLIWIFARWRPKASFSRHAFRGMFGFGSRLAAAGLISTLYDNLYTLAIGKTFSPATLGYYTRADHFGGFLAVNTSHVMARVTYPVMCSLQDDSRRLREVFLRFLRAVSFVVFPLMTGMSVLSEPFILTVLGERWLPAAGMMRALCVALMFYPVHAVNLNVLQVKGRSDLYLRLEVVKKLIGASILLATLPMGVLAICWGSAANSVICLMVNSLYCRRLIGVSVPEQIRVLLPPLLMSAAAGGAGHLAALLPDSPSASLLAGMATGAAIYLLLARLFRTAGIRELTALIASSGRRTAEV